MSIIETFVEILMELEEVAIEGLELSFVPVLKEVPLEPLFDLLFCRDI
jgi:hypothetical protein